MRDLQPIIVDPLSARERDCLRLVSELNDNAEIARVLLITVNTVKTHLRTAYCKLGVDNRRDAVRRAMETGQLPHPYWVRCENCHGTGRVPVLESADGN